jgi:hypothetical protein
VAFAATANRATLSRGRVVYATGSASRGRLVLRARRTVRAGRYTLAIGHRAGGRLVTSREQIRVS